MQIIAIFCCIPFLYEVIDDLHSPFPIRLTALEILVRESFDIGNADGSPEPSGIFNDKLISKVKELDL